MGRYRYFLALQTLLPDSYSNDREFIDRLKILQNLGFDGVELNIRDPNVVDPERLKNFLGDFNLRLSMFATGFTAKTEGLSLASTDDAKRTQSIKRTKEFLSFAEVFGAGIIVGFLKGVSGESSPKHREALSTSIRELSIEAKNRSTPLLIEAINRFESPLGHSLDDTWSLIGDANLGYTYILPDTWHMNIEESNTEAAIVKHQGHFINFHLSENNRYFPGYGSIHFNRIIGVLDALGYRGRLAIEGNLRRGFDLDVRKTMEILAPLLSSDG